MITAKISEKMREMTLHDVQFVSLEIMRHLHNFCKKNNIKYSLGYGSLIGAIRHHGFIPWDDDIDVVMMREDFDRFCSIYEDTDEFKLFSFSRRNTYSTVARLCEMKKTYVRTWTPLFTEKTGCWIDIFALDTVEEEREFFEKRIPSFKDIHKKILYCRWQMRKFSLKELLHVRTFLRWVLNVRKAKSEIEELLNIQNDLCLAQRQTNSTMMSMLVFPTYIDRDYSPKNCFSEVIDATFENENFKIMKGYDEWLRIIYGDYMVLPPEEQQKRAHSMHKYYWTN